MAKAIENVTTPVGNLEWVFITGEGKEDLQGNPTYTVSLVLEGDQAKVLEEQINDFWEANRPKGISEPKSLGFYAHTAKDAEGEKVETGKTAFVFKTGTTFPNGNPKVIKVFNAKGAEVSLGDKKIGNESRGRVQGAMGIYEVQQKGRTLQAGVTLYLNGLQLTKFVEFVGGASFDAIEDEDAGEDSFEGFGEMGAVLDEKAPEAEKEATTEKKTAGKTPRL